MGFMVSTQPPWSTATSTITAPFFINLRSSRLISIGAFAPGKSTAPIIRSLSLSIFSIFASVQYNVVMREPNMSSRYSSLLALISRIVTSAPIPVAILQAFVPTTPPPIIETLPRLTPGTPPNSTPLPP